MQPIAGKNHPFQPGQPQLDAFVRDVESFLLGRERPAADAGTSTNTILFTDLESSTQQPGDAKAQEILNGHNNTVRTALTDHGGNEVNDTGDGILAAFTSAVEASL